MTADAIFFDLDGTLCHPRAPFNDLFLACCAPLLADGLVSGESLLQAWGTTLEEPGPATSSTCLAHALAACGGAANAGLIERCAGALNEAWAEAQALNEGAADTLTLLRGKSCRVGLITNGPSDAQRAVVAALGLEVWLQWIVVSGDANVGVRKPHAGIFRHALAASDAEARETWYVGDSARNDIAGAASAGLRTCWFAASDQVCPSDMPQPDSRIAALTDLVQVLAL